MLKLPGGIDHQPKDAEALLLVPGPRSDRGHGALRPQSLLPGVCALPPALPDLPRRGGAGDPYSRRPVKITDYDSLRNHIISLCGVSWSILSCFSAHVEAAYLLLLRTIEKVYIFYFGARVVVFPGIFCNLLTVFIILIPPPQPEFPLSYPSWDWPRSLGRTPLIDWLIGLIANVGSSEFSSSIYSITFILIV